MLETPTKTPTIIKAPEKSTFTSGDKLESLKNIDDLIEEYNTPKHDYTPKPPPEPATTEETDAKPETPPDFNDITADLFSSPESKVLTPEQTQANAGRLVKMIDGTVATGLNWWSKEKDKTQFQASTTEKADLTEAWESYLEGKDFDISPGMYLLWANATTYGPRALSANAIRQMKDMDERLKRLEKIEAEKAESPAE